jgi:hypothetical protein
MGKNKKRVRAGEGFDAHGWPWRACLAVQAVQKCRGGEAVVAMDPRMRRTPASVAAVERMLALAAQCVAAARKDRPAMRRCTELLWTIRREYHRHEEPRCATVAEERSNEWVLR